MVRWYPRAVASGRLHSCARRRRLGVLRRRAARRVGRRSRCGADRPADRGRCAAVEPAAAAAAAAARAAAAGDRRARGERASRSRSRRAADELMAARAGRALDRECERRAAPRRRSSTPPRSSAPDDLRVVVGRGCRWLRPARDAGHRSTRSRARRPASRRAAAGLPARRRAALGRARARGRARALRAGRARPRRRARTRRRADDLLHPGMAAGLPACSRSPTPAGGPDRRSCEAAPRSAPTDVAGAAPARRGAAARRPPQRGRRRVAASAVAARPERRRGAGRARRARLRQGRPGAGVRRLGPLVARPPATTPARASTWPCCCCWLARARSEARAEFRQVQAMRPDGPARRASRQAWSRRRG